MGVDLPHQAELVRSGGVDVIASQVVVDAPAVAEPAG